jgi:hypothetical protein
MLQLLHNEYDKYLVSIYTETYTNILDLEVNQYPITQLKIYTIIHIT